MAGGDRKIGRNKKSASNVAYKAQDRLSRNKRRRAARAARIEAAHVAKRSAVAVKRKQGAVKRLERRIASGAVRLTGTLDRAKAALVKAQGGVQ